MKINEFIALNNALCDQNRLENRPQGIKIILNKGEIVTNENTSLLLEEDERLGLSKIQLIGRATKISEAESIMMTISNFLEICAKVKNKKLDEYMNKLGFFRGKVDEKGTKIKAHGLIITAKKNINNELEFEIVKYK